MRAAKNEANLRAQFEQMNDGLELQIQQDDMEESLDKDQTILDLNAQVDELTRLLQVASLEQQVAVTTKPTLEQLMTNVGRAKEKALNTYGSARKHSIYASNLTAMQATIDEY